MVWVFVPVVVGGCRGGYRGIGGLWGSMARGVFGTSSSFGGFRHFPDIS